VYGKLNTIRGNFREKELTDSERLYDFGGGKNPLTRGSAEMVNSIVDG
jgi:hypothetical protein